MGQYPTYLIHYGIPGQKWGIRRFQNEDGTLTEEGIRRYGRLIDKAGSSERHKKKLEKFEDKIDVGGARTRSHGISDYASRKDKIRYNKRFDKEIHSKMHEASNNAADKRQIGKDPMQYIKEYTNLSLEAANKLVNQDQSEASQKIIQRYVDMTMNGLNYKLWEIGDFNSYNEHPTKYNQIDYSYDVKNKKLSQKKWKSDWK